MKKQIAVGSLVAVLSFVSLTARAAEELPDSPQATCGKGLATIGFLIMFIGAQAGGGISAQVANQRGWFESEEAWKARVDENQGRGLRIAAAGAAVLVVGAIVWGTAPNGAPPPRVTATVAVTGLPEGARLWFGGSSVATAIVNGRATATYSDVRKGWPYTTQVIVRVGDDVYDGQIEFTGGTVAETVLPFTSLARRR